MNPKHFISLAISFWAACACSGASAGIVWNELPPGAGETIDTAQVTTSSVSAAIDSIQGLLSSSVLVGAGPRNEVDLYRIRIDDTSLFSARTVSSNPDDTALFLFNAGGFGIEMNDDNGFDLLSALPSFAGAGGIYTLGVALGGFEALDGIGNTVFQFGALFSDVRPGDPASGPLAAWSEGFASLNEPGLGYTIELTGASAAVPEPSALALIGIAGFAAWRARRRPIPAQAAA
jgi:hypothetical protein